MSFVLCIKNTRCKASLELRKIYIALSDEQAEKIEETIDAISERIRSLGFFSKGIFSVFLKDTTVKEEVKFHPIMSPYIFMSSNSKTNKKEIKIKQSRQSTI